MRSEDKPVTVSELRARIFRKKEARRVRLAALPVLEKFRLMEQMRERAKVVLELRQARPR